MGRGRVDPPRAAALRRRGPLRDRAPHRGLEQLHAAQSAAIVRGIEIYHVKGNGWNDIGYNFLVDKYGQVFEGRYGGVDRPVIGAHAEGFNTGSVGVAVIGDYDSTRSAGGGEDRARAAARLAARPRARRSALDAHVASRRQPALPGGVAGVPARDLRPPRHRTSPTARATRSTRSCRRSRRTSPRSAARRSTRPRRREAGEGQVRFTARLSRRAAVDGHRRRLRPASQVAQGSGHRDAPSTGRGMRSPRRRIATRGRSRRRTRARRPARSARRRRSPCRRRPRLAAAVAPGETTTVSYTLTAPATRHRDARLADGHVLVDAAHRAEAGRRADARVHAAARAARTASTRSPSRATAGAKTATATVPFDDRRHARRASPRRARR